MKTMILTALALLTLPGMASAKDKAPPPPEPATHPDWATVRTKSDTLALSDLVDPGSAQLAYTSGFKWGYAKAVFGPREWGWIACGTLNAKNRMGGYVGPEPFYIFVGADGHVFKGPRSVTTVPCDAEITPLQPELMDAHVATAGATGVADELEKLATLRDKGIITQAEFEGQKAKLLAK